LAEQPRKRSRDLENGHGVTRPDIHWQIVGAGRFEHEHQAVDDIVDRHEVAHLTAVLEHDWLPVIEQPAQEDRGHARVRVAQALAWSVYVEESRRDGRDSVRPPDEEHHLFLVVLRHRINVVAIEGFAFGRWNRLDMSVTHRTALLP